jgi:hypothetical protein
MCMWFYMFAQNHMHTYIHMCMFMCVHIHVWCSLEWDQVHWGGEWDTVAARWKH